MACRTRLPAGRFPVEQSPREEADVTAGAPSATQVPAWPEEATCLRVEDLVIDLRYRRVEGPEAATELPNRMFDLLLVFLARPHVLHTRTALFEEVWRGTVVEDANLSQSIWMLRKALGPTRRHWIRTVPGSGYVFEPPGPVLAGGADTATPGRDDAVQAPAAPAPPHPETSGRPRWLPATLAIFVLACATLGVAAWQKGRDAAPIQPVTVALLEVGTAAGGEHAWPARLLHAWLGWKLRQLPEAVVLGEPDLAGDGWAPDPAVVLLTSGPAGDGNTDLFVRAQLVNGAGAARPPMELRGTRMQMPEMVDRLSKMVVDAIAPGRSTSAWPALGIDADGAQTYADVVAARHARDWPGVVAGAQRLLQEHPGFGLVRLDLAQAQARLGEAAIAQEQMAQARRLLAPLPEDAARMMDARELALSPHKAPQAAAAYAELAEAHPRHSRFRLHQARQLVRAGEARAALEILGDPARDHEPLETRIGRLLTDARARMLLGDAEGARASAREAARMTQLAGRGWELELAESLMLLARSSLLRRDDDAALVMLEQSARQFDLAGSTARALAMRFHADLVRSPEAADDPVFESLLELARRTGDRDAEIELLHAVAHRHYRAGQHRRYRERLDQAAAIANESGNRFWRHQVELDLLDEDILLGDLHSAHKRIQRLQGAPTAGGGAARLALAQAYLLEQRGRTAQAPATLAQAGRGPDAGGGFLPPASRAGLACARARLLLRQGRLGEAGDALVGCRGGGPLAQLEAGLLDARRMQLSGRPRAATLRLSSLAAEADAPNPVGPERFWLTLDQADLYNRAGMPEQAQALLRGVREGAERTGHSWLLALAETGLAEAAAAQGAWEAAGRHAASARRLVPGDTRSLSRRLDLVETVLALAGGRVEEAAGHLARLDAESHLSGDAPAILEVHSLAPGGADPGSCPGRGPADIAEDGLGGASLEWLAASLPDSVTVPAHALQDELARR